MKLSECTKAELLQILGQLAHDRFTETEIERHLMKIERARIDRTADKAAAARLFKALRRARMEGGL